MLKKLRRPFRLNASSRDMEAISEIDIPGGIAEGGRNEYECLEEACRHNDQVVLLEMARHASDEKVRLEAALALGNEAVLTAMALKEWDIRRGAQLTAHIATPMLLRRVARSALQDRIRMTAALRLGDIRLLRLVATTAADIQVRWQITLHLDDPHLMADIAMFKPGSRGMATLRKRAHRALMLHLDQLGRKKLGSALLAFMYIEKHLAFKLEAFARLPDEYVGRGVLRHLSRQDFQAVPEPMIMRMLAKLESCGWTLGEYTCIESCGCCRGQEESQAMGGAANQSRITRENRPCPECRGRDRNFFRRVVCRHPGHEQVTFNLPACLQVGRLQKAADTCRLTMSTEAS